MKNKILLSFTLFISCFLVFIFAVFAWFTLDDNSKSEDINTGIIDIDCDVNFEYLNDTSWIKIDKINHINLINPNDYIYFRLTLSTKKSKEVTINNCRFYNVSSTISNELKYQNNEIYVTDKKNNIIKLYDIIDDKVLVNKKTLYKIENGEIKLDEYKVHHALRFYVIDEQVNLNSKIKSFVNGNGKTIDELLFTEAKITKDKSYSIIFALELNEEAMKLDNLDYSYCYSYQSFFIDSIIADVK